jgi:hypothetical protein
MRNKTRNEVWNEVRKELKKEFEEKGITSCELGLVGCKRDNFLSFAHRHKRAWYYDKDERRLLGSFEQVLLLCIYPCHDTLEKDSKLTEEIFIKLRGEERI